MDDILNEVFDDVVTFNPQHYKNMTVVGLKIPNKNNLDLMSLEIGLDLGLVQITEVSEEGSVGEVKVVNNAVTPLLLLDGEQIIGSKQNRIVNTTIIIPAKSEKVIPVSCTESGRWNYDTATFHYSNHMATSNVRRDKLTSVSNSLRNSLSFKSDQSQVWDNIAQTQELLSVESNTNALNDSYKQKSVTIDDYKKAFSLQERQNGLIVYINGKLMGLEMIYNNARYKDYHDKLVESYIIDAIKTNDDYNNQLQDNQLDKDEFIKDICNARRESFESVGLGMDYRIEDDKITGSAMVFDKTVINASFFKKCEA